jgi:hypothetical protein
MIARKVVSSSTNKMEKLKEEKAGVSIVKVDPDSEVGAAAQVDGAPNGQTRAVDDMM